MRACQVCGAPTDQPYHRFCPEHYAQARGWVQPRPTHPDAFNAPTREVAPRDAVRAGCTAHWLRGFREGYRVGLHDRDHNPEEGT